MSDVTGGSSTQRSLVQSIRTAFNLRNEKDVVVLLRHIHQSSMQPDDKNELRDAVFVFRNSPKSELTPELRAKFSEHDFVLSDEDTAAVEEVVQSQSSMPVQKPAGQFGASRPSPQFSRMVTTPDKQAPVSEPVAVKPAPVEPVVEPEEKVVVQVSAAVEPPVASEPVIVTPPVPEPQENIVTTPVPSPAPQKVVAPALVADTAGALGRIKEIKKEVNLLVGNPVNLIDVHNEIGREYMNSLLDAMKKNNGGTAEEVEQAMGRLETAFVSVKQAVAGAEEAAPVESAEPATVPVAPEVAVAQPATPEPLPAVPEKHTVPEPVVQPTKPAVEPVRTASGFASVHQTHVKNVVTPAGPTPVPQIDEGKIVPTVEPVPTLEISVVPPKETPAPVAQESAEEKSPMPNSVGIMSVAKEKQIQDLMTTEKQQAATTDQQRKAIEIAAMDPLMTPEVTSGLQQLLSEWSLFKSSGIFGTGPSGMEHHLYKKLAILNMTAVVAGRFEGATPDIKRSITDYMNGWRYEEGILQVQGELFEHYLRRVIKHILDKRSSSLPKT